MTLQFLNTETGRHHTYRFSVHKQNPDFFWVSEGVYRLGWVRGQEFRPKEAHRGGQLFKIQEIFGKLWRLTHRGLPNNFEVSNVAGNCLRCNKPLTVGESIAQGFGPECITKVAALDLRNS